MITSELRRVVTLSVVEGNVTREEALGLLRLICGVLECFFIL